MEETPDIGAWLTSVGLAEHIPVFRRERIDLDVLPQLSDDDLISLALPLGDRRRLSKAVAEYRRARQAEERAASSERRQITVMFCDLVGSTSIMEKLDPEESSDLLRAYREVASQATRQFGGQITRLLGDGLLLMFGYPLAHEDDVERSVRTGLAIVAGVQEIRLPSLQKPLQVRIGIATGTCVVGDLASHESLDPMGFIGGAGNLAARLQEQAPPDSIVVAPSTRQRLDSSFEFVELGERNLKGFAQPVQLSVVRGPRAVRTLFEARRGSGTPDLVGRISELQVMCDAWASACRRRGSAVLLAGEAGLGKSRLIMALCARIGSARQDVVWWQCSPYYQSTALHPVVEYIRTATGADRGDGLPVSFALPPTVALEVGEELLRDLLTPTRLQVARPLRRSAKEQRAATLAFIVAHLRTLAERSPLLLVVEDLHWADPSTLELLTGLFAELAESPILVLATHRPGFESPWPPTLPVTTLDLQRLAPEQSRALVHAIAPDALDESTVEAIVERADGVPLFVEELTRTVLTNRESGTAGRGSDDPDQVPASIQDALTARLDRAGPAREIAQTAAVLGREFAVPLLADTLGREALEIEAQLQQLVGLALLEPSDRPGRSGYRFTHALVRDAAYDSILKRGRKELHGRVARSIERLNPDVVAHSPELVGHHWSRAGEAARALDCWLAAGGRSLAASAHREALAHARRGLECIAKLPETAERDALELRVQSLLGRAAISTSGHASPEVESAFGRAQQLANQAEVGPDLFPVMWGINAFHLVRGDIHSNLRTSAQLVEVAEAEGDLDHRVVAHASRLLSLYYAGDLAEARGQLEIVRTLYDVRRHGSLAHVYAVDRKVIALQHGSWVMWILGYPDQARDLEEELNEHARGLGHPYTLAQALTSGASVYVLRREPATMLARATEGIAIANAQKSPVWVDHGGFWTGWAHAEAGDPERGLRDMLGALELYRANGSGSSLPKLLALIAGARIRLGQLDEAGRQLANALEHSHRWGELCYVAEILRLQADVGRLTRAEPLAIETRLNEGLAVARRQQARGWELRLATSLARHLVAHDRPAEARAALEPVLAWFREGFGTRDLIEAQELLAGC